jgi:hypothetical protein
MKRTILVQKAKLSDHRGNMIKLLIREKGRRAVIVSFNETNFHNDDLLEILKHRKDAFLSAYEHARKHGLKKVLSAKLHLFWEDTRGKYAVGYDGKHTGWCRKNFPLLYFYDFEIAELPKAFTRERLTFCITYGDV